MVAARDADPSPLADEQSWFSRVRNSPVTQKALALGSELLPKGLYARALLIIITPIVVLEGVIAFAFMERHWQAVTRRLSEATARDIAALIDVYEDMPKKDGPQKIIDLARDRLNLTLEVLPPGDLPPPRPKPYFALLDRALSNELRRNVQLPFWIDTTADAKNVEIRVKHDNGILRFIATRSQTYASNFLRPVPATSFNAGSRTKPSRRFMPSTALSALTRHHRRQARPTFCSTTSSAKLMASSASGATPRAAWGQSRRRWQDRRKRAVPRYARMRQLSRSRWMVIGQRVWC